MFSTVILPTLLLSFATATRRGNVTAQDADRCGSRCNDHWDCGTSSPCTVCYDNCVDPAVCVNTTEAVPIQCVKPTEAAITTATLCNIDPPQQCPWYNANNTDEQRITLLVGLNLFLDPNTAAIDTH